MGAVEGNTNPVEQFHSIAWEIGRDGLEATFTCSAPVGASCRLTCPADCPEWDADDHEHAMVDNGSCVLVEWLENDDATAAEMYFGGTHPLENGPVELRYLRGGGVEWAYLS